MKKILVIDDDRDICLLLNRFLTRRGYEVIEMYTGKKALVWLDSNQPNLVMCDYRLGDMDAMEMLTSIKNKYADVPVIIITGYSDMRTAVKVMKMGAYDYITKPLLPDEIIHTIQQAIEHSENSSANPAAKTKTSAPDKPVAETARCHLFRKIYFRRFGSIPQNIKTGCPCSTHQL